MIDTVFFSSLKGKRKISMLTAYDYPNAKIFTEAGIDILLVGDSLGMAVLGYQDTKSVTLQDMLRHGAAVVRGVEAAVNKGASRPLIVIDMPLHTTDTVGMAIHNCRYVLDQTGADAVKIEGNTRIVQALAEAGVSVMGHTGLKPQFAKVNKVCGRGDLEAEMLLNEALMLEKSGAFAIVLECIPSELAGKITAALNVPTIGIGASNLCDGQVLVSSDMTGLYNEISPKFVRKYADLAVIIHAAANSFRNDVESGNFPAPNETYYN